MNQFKRSVCRLYTSRNLLGGFDDCRLSQPTMIESERYKLDHAESHKILEYLEELNSLSMKKIDGFRVDTLFD